MRANIIVVSALLGCSGSSFDVASVDDAALTDTALAGGDTFSGGDTTPSDDTSLSDASRDSSVLDTATIGDSGVTIDSTVKTDTGTKADSAPIDSFVTDTAPIDAADKCADKVCSGAFMECCPLTGGCYDTRCLSCCMTFAAPP